MHPRTFSQFCENDRRGDTIAEGQVQAGHVVVWCRHLAMLAKAVFNTRSGCAKCANTPGSMIMQQLMPI